MVQMGNMISAKLRAIKGLSERPIVNCITCHRGDLKPALDLPEKKWAGVKQILRTTEIFFKISDKEVRQLGEISNDNGANWQAEYDLMYKK